jgi:hypothetical protein
MTLAEAGEIGLRQVPCSWPKFYLPDVKRLAAESTFPAKKTAVKGRAG